MFCGKWIGVKIIFVVVFVCLFAKESEGVETTIKVTIDMANIRLEPDKESQVVYQVPFGTILLSSGKFKDWYRVELPQRKDQVPIVGYIHQSVVQEIPSKKGEEIETKEVKSAVSVVPEAIIAKRISLSDHNESVLNRGKPRNYWMKLETKYFIPSEQSIKHLYGESMVLGGEVNIKIYKFLLLWINGNYYSKDGNLPYTEEKTRMTLIPIGVGLKARFQWKAVRPYIGIGPMLYSYKEVNPIGKAQGTGLGIIGQAGIYAILIKRFFFDVSFDYIYCEVRPQSIKADLGGIKAGIGLGFEF